MIRLERTDPSHLELDIRFSPAGSLKPSDLMAAILGLDRDTAASLPLRKTHAFYRHDVAGHHTATQMA